MKQSKKELLALTRRQLSEEEEKELSNQSEVIVFGETIDNMDIYYIYQYDYLDMLDNKPSVVLFLEDADFISYIQQINEKEENVSFKGKWAASSLERCFSNAGVDGSFTFLKNSLLKEDDFDTISHKQQTIQETRIASKHLREKNAIDQRMLHVPKIPKNFYKWINKKGKKKALFMQEENNLIFFEHVNPEESLAFCTFCDSHFTTPRLKHNEEVKCACCKKELKAKMKSRYTQHAPRDCWYIIQRTKENEVILRFFEGTKKYEKNPEQASITYSETGRKFIDTNGNVETYSFDFFKDKELRWCKGERECSYPGTGLFRIKGSYFDVGPVYPSNLTTTFKGLPWGYCNLKKQFEEPILKLERYLLGVLRFPQVEYLEKVGLNYLAIELCGRRESDLEAFLENREVHKLDLFLGVEKKDLKQVIRNGFSVDELSFYKIVKKLFTEKNKKGIAVSPEISDDVFRTLFYGFVTNRFFKSEIEANLAWCAAKGSPKKIANYLNKQITSLAWEKRLENLKGERRKLKEVCDEWIDYLKMVQTATEQAEKQKKEICSFDVFPSQLIKAHDFVCELVEIEKVKTKDAIIQQLNTKWEQFKYKDESLMVVPPTSTLDFIKESNTLKHCVKNYVDSVCKEKSVVLFIRSVNLPEEPLYTLELNNNRITQCRGYRNQPIPPEAQSFVEKWKQYLKKKQKLTIA